MTKATHGQNPSYFLISVSTLENLELCKRYALAGFMNNTSGVWTFSEVRVGDFVSFLYGAKVHNLYEVQEKTALVDAETLPPWKPITFRESKRTYHFPFRLQLTPIRQLEEALVRAEFTYVAENLLLRGGYRRTHFQADQTTLQNVSQMGRLVDGPAETLAMPPHTIFTPSFSRKRAHVSMPHICLLNETVLQALLRQHLSDYRHLEAFLRVIKMEDLRPRTLEVLGEKALPQGHIDLLVKEATPRGTSHKIIIEVKNRQATGRDFEQLRSYVDEVGTECVAGILAARGFTKTATQRVGEKIIPLNISFRNPSLDIASFNEWKANIELDTPALLTRFRA